MGDRRLDRDLGEVAQHAGVVVVALVGQARMAAARRRSTRQAFIAWASWNVRRTVSMIRPMPCESELTIWIAPSSWSGPSAAIVAGCVRSRMSARSSATPNVAPWLRTVIATPSSTALTPHGIVGVVEEQMTFASRTMPIRSGTCPPPVPSTWYAWTVRPGDRGDGVLELRALVQAVGVQAHRDVVAVREAERRVDQLRVRAVVLVDLEPDRPGLEQELERGGVGRPGIRLEPDVDREALEAAERPLHRRGRLVEAGADQRRDAARQRGGDEVRADRVDVAVDRARASRSGRSPRSARCAGRSGDRSRR